MQKLISISLFALLASCSANKISVVERNYLLNEKNNDKYYLIQFIRKSQKENKLGEIPMLIIDGVPIYYFYKKDSEPIKIGRSQIINIKITENTTCAHVFGAACKYGLITIKTY
ncbi:hypothetical protein [Chryseobacterium wangxinyae]|uniref:hypothetical protein n=1 Tax=Chryseobacterium sp. CY353 TaxID=2997334 RepID=UPI002270A1DE|nr:hypothetical protein [Chryseobacterium sp. CY353]MCY0969739.1 hypothetical protein [Chryseobacterium sp. CY353]